MKSVTGLFCLSRRACFAKLVALRNVAASQVGPAIADFLEMTGDVASEDDLPCGKTASRAMVEGRLAAFYEMCEDLSKADFIVASFDETNTWTNRNFLVIELGGVIHNSDGTDTHFLRPVYVYETVGHANAATVSSLIHETIGKVAQTQRELGVHQVSMLDVQLFIGDNCTQNTGKAAGVYQNSENFCREMYKRVRTPSNNTQQALTHLCEQGKMTARRVGYVPMEWKGCMDHTQHPSRGCGRPPAHGVHLLPHPSLVRRSTLPSNDR